jgi:pimeloyl-ACP methyl ester carboxylesterase
VLLRGLMREARHWGEFAPKLEGALPGGRVLAIDLPGNGRLHRARSPTCIADMTEHCREALAQQGLSPPWRLLAISLGAMTAIDWLSRYPDEVAGCVLINTSLRSLGPFHWRLRPRTYPAIAAALLQPRDARRQEELILRLTSAREALRAAALDARVAIASECPVCRGNVLRQLLAAARFRLPPGRPPMPVLLLASAADGLVDPRCSQRLAERWRLPLALHADAGHDLPLDDPDWVLERVADWLRSTRREAQVA